MVDSSTGDVLYFAYKSATCIFYTRNISQVAIIVKKVIVISGEKRTKLPRLTTTHCREGAKPAFIGVPAEINGEKAIAFMKGGEIVSYITMLEIMDKLYIENKMIAEVDF
jgi:hypothetical protein